MNEPNIIINGIQLTTAQAMTVRVALSGCRWDCGDDKHGIALRKAYEARTREVLAIMFSQEPK